MSNETEKQNHEDNRIDHNSTPPAHQFGPNKSEENMQNLGAAASNASSESLETSASIKIKAPSPQLITATQLNDERYIKFGFFFLLITLGVFSIWAIFAPLSSALLSTGEVVVNSYRKSIQHYEGGIVENIYVKNGDKVSAGAPLIRLDAIKAEARQVSNRKRLLTAKAELERLLAEQNFATNLTFSEELEELSRGDPDTASALIQQRQLFTARLSAFNQEQEALKTRTEQTRQQISGLSLQTQFLKEQVSSLKQEQHAFTTLFQEGLGDGQRARELNRSVLSALNELARLESETARLKIQLTEMDLQAASRKQDYLKDVGERIRTMQSSYYDFQEIMETTTDQINRATIRAPESGVVVGMNVLTVGSVAAPGQTLLDIVPEHDTFVIEAKLMPQDINEVHIGQKADIRFSAFNANTTKVIEGKVIQISADRLINERDSMPYYLARIQVTKEGVSDMTADMELKPGMPAEVMIKRGDRTLFSYLIKPISDSFARSLKED